MCAEPCAQVIVCRGEPRGAAQEQEESLHHHMHIYSLRVECGGKTSAHCVITFARAGRYKAAAVMAYCCLAVAATAHAFQNRRLPLKCRQGAALKAARSTQRKKFHKKRVSQGNGYLLITLLELLEDV